VKSLPILLPPPGESKPNLCLCAEGVDYAILDAKDPEALTEEEKIALLGRPCLGTNTKIQIRIKESKEFKVGAEKRTKEIHGIERDCLTRWNFDDMYG
jgi:hypothetical protein